MRTKEKIIASWLAVADLPQENINTVPLDEPTKAELEQRLAEHQGKLQELSAELGTDLDPALLSGKFAVMRPYGEPHLSAYAKILDEICDLPDFDDFACHLLPLASRELEPSITLRLVTRLTEVGNFDSARRIAKFGSVNRPGDRQYFYFRLLAQATRSPEDVLLLRDAAEALDDEGEFHLAANARVDVFEISASDDDLKLARAAAMKVPQPWSRAMSFASLGAFSADPEDFAAAFTIISETGKNRTMDVLMLIDKVTQAIGSLKKESPIPLDRIYELIATVPDQRWRDNLRKQVRSSQPARA